ncbi:MAG: RMD1 family protein [Gammaproteobacteria bacterium]|nr:RMD1 family protein [Gammaproteobacteria bacterium]
MSNLYEENQSFIIRAHHIADRIRRSTDIDGEIVADFPLTIQVNDNGYAVIFRYGSTVFFNLTPEEEKNLLEKISEYSSVKLEIPETEQQQFCIDKGRSEGIYNDTLSLKELSVEQIQLVAEILAKSVALAYYERLIAEAMTEVEPMATRLQQSGRSSGSNKVLLKRVGTTLAIQHKMLGRIEVKEKPELLWDRPDLERLYLRLEDEYELQERHSALEQKLDLITRTSETLLELMRYRSTHRVEWYITILIVIEIFLTLSELH